MNKKFLALIVLFSLLIPLANASSTSNLSITLIPENINQPYVIYIHNQNNTFNKTYNVSGIAEIIDLKPGIYYLKISSQNYNNIYIVVNLTKNMTFQLYFNSNIIGYGIENYYSLIFSLAIIFAIFGLLVIMTYYMKGVKVKWIKYWLL